MKYGSSSNPEKFIIKGIPFLFVIGALLHFAYDLLGECPVTGIFAPVNESVWEHLKLILWPVVLWWTVYFAAKGKKYEINKNKWFAGALTSLLVSLVSVPLIFYFYTEAFGTENVWIDILILLAALTLGQLTGLHIYKYSKGINMKIVIIIFALLVILFGVFTFFTPEIPLFLDGQSGTYGIAA